MKLPPRSKKNLILYGPTLISDRLLIHELENDFYVILCSQLNLLLRIPKKKKIDIVLFEMNSHKSELKNLERFIKRFPNSKIIVIGAGKQMGSVAQIFKMGAEDFFRLPYRRDLLVERVRVLGMLEEKKFKSK